MTTKITQQFEAEVSKAVSMIIAASYRAAVSLLDEAFSQAQEKRGGRGHPSTSDVPLPQKRNAQRRDPADIETLVNRLRREIWASPGESINVLATRMSVAPKELRVPIRRMKDQGLLRTVGANQGTRYFPVAPSNGEPLALPG